MRPYYSHVGISLYLGDVRAVLRELPAESVQCVVTSPPYWGLRDYGNEPTVWGGREDCQHDWGDWQESHDEREPENVAGKSRTTDRFYGDESRRFNGNHQKHSAGAFCRHCGAWLGCYGLEPTPELYVEHTVEIFRAVRRVLRDDGTLWLNLGDSYANDEKWGGMTGGKHVKALHGAPIGPIRKQTGLKPKDLVGIPWRVAFTLQADGWYLRSDIIWSKPNPMPESVTDRPTKAHEYLFLLSKGPRYYYDAETIREPHQHMAEARGVNGSFHDHKNDQGLGQRIAYKGVETYNPAGRNRRTVWTIATEAFPEAHFATFPTELVKPCILAGTSEAGACPECGTPWERVRQKCGERPSHSGSKKPSVLMLERRGEKSLETSVFADGMLNVYTTTGWRPGCKHADLKPIPQIVLDPFSGAGTTVMVAKQLGRHGIGIDLKAEYHDMAVKRLQQDVLPLAVQP